MSPWPVLLRLGFASVIAYRAELVIWFLTTTMPLVMLAMWSAAAAAGPIEGFGQPEFVTYFAVALAVRHLSSAWIVWELNADIRSGALSMQLLRPIHPFAMRVAENLGALPMRVVLLVPIVGALFALLPAAPPTSDPALWALGVVSLGAAWVLMFSCQTIAGLLSLWTGQSLGIWEAFFGLFTLLSGYLVPLDLFPGRLIPWLRLLPFRGLGGLPVEIVVGRLTRVEAMEGLIVQLAWIAVAIAVARALWQRGLARFGAFGG